MRAVTDEFMTKATWHFQSKVEVSASAEQVFSILTDDTAWKHWHPEVSNIQWLTPEPRAPGTMRTVKFTHPILKFLLFGPVILTEYFFRWDEGRRVSFYLDKTNRPRFLVFRACMEDYRCIPLDEKRCEYVRDIYVEPSLLIWLLGFMMKPIFSSMVERTTLAMALYALKRFNQNN